MARCGICNGISENSKEIPDPYDFLLYGKTVMGTWCDRCLAERTVMGRTYAAKLSSLMDEAPPKADHSSQISDTSDISLNSAQSSDTTALR